MTEIIFRLEKHINFLFLNNIMDFNQKNQILGNIFIISKNLNTSYNNFIIDKLDNKHILDLKISELVNLFDLDINNNFMIENMINILKKSFDKIPLFEQENELLEIINETGYDNINDLVEIYNNKFDISLEQQQILNEINKIFVPTKINYYDVSNHNEEYYWRLPVKFEENDLLELSRELWIKNLSSSTEYLKIEG